MTEAFLKYAQQGVSGVRVIGGIPYAIIETDQRPYIYNLQTNQKLASTSNAYTFNTSATSIYFFKFPNRMLASINPVSNEMTMLHARPNDYKSDVIFVFGTRPYILLDGSDKIVLANGNQATYCTSSNVSPVAVNTKNVLILQNMIFCANVVIKYDAELEIFSQQPLPTDAAVVSALQRLREAFRIEDDFYEDGYLLGDEMLTVMRFYNLQCQKLEQNAFPAPFSEAIATEVRYARLLLSSAPYYEKLKKKPENTKQDECTFVWKEVSDLVVYGTRQALHDYQRSRTQQVWEFEDTAPTTYAALSAKAGEYSRLRCAKSKTEAEKLMRFRAFGIHEQLKRFEREFQSTEEGARALFEDLRRHMEEL